MKPNIDIDYICSLANLKLTKEERSLIGPQLMKIVEWVNKLEELKFEVSRGEVHTPVSFSLSFRQDKIGNSIPAEKAIASSPEKNNEFIKVPKVFGKK